MTIDYLLIELKVLNGNREVRLVLSNIVDPAIVSQSGFLDLKTERENIWFAEISVCAWF